MRRLPYASSLNVAGYACFFQVHRSIEVAKLEAAKLEAAKLEAAKLEAALNAYFQKNHDKLKEAKFLLIIRYAIFKCTESDADNVQQNIETLKFCLKEGALIFKNIEIGCICEEAYSSLMASAFTPARAMSRLS